VTLSVHLPTLLKFLLFLFYAIIYSSPFLSANLLLLSPFLSKLTYSFPFLSPFCWLFLPFLLPFLLVFPQSFANRQFSYFSFLSLANFFTLPFSLPLSIYLTLFSTFSNANSLALLPPFASPTFFYLLFLLFLANSLTDLFLCHVSSLSLPLFPKATLYFSSYFPGRLFRSSSFSLANSLTLPPFPSPVLLLFLIFPRQFSLVNYLPLPPSSLSLANSLTTSSLSLDSTLTLPSFQ
jgi:hypothetical protein